MKIDLSSLTVGAGEQIELPLKRNPTTNTHTHYANMDDFIE